MHPSTSTIIIPEASYLPTPHVPSIFPVPMPPTPSIGNDGYTHSNTGKSCSSTTKISNVNEKVTYGFGILLETSPGFFRISGDRQATVVALESLETTLAGTVLLIEYDGHYLRIFTWLLID
ncbi:hypothetical protein OCU04_009811 [Sclerotinia nivalis]|uniref:Uncharacterized protein n=1 Tax=Sclerotinia nivalis TaxID=352851 RepID=A0A9X0AFU3_9HELO|nr:hypothetical protein OCU04_009811 [Sclerotinia nivalis]